MLGANIRKCRDAVGECGNGVSRAVVRCVKDGGQRAKLDRHGADAARGSIRAR